MKGEHFGTEARDVVERNPITRQSVSSAAAATRYESVYCVGSASRGASIGSAVCGVGRFSKEGGVNKILNRSSEKPQKPTL